MGTIKTTIAVLIFLCMIDFPLSLFVIAIFIWITTKVG